MYKYTNSYLNGRLQGTFGIQAYFYNDCVVSQVTVVSLHNASNLPSRKNTMAIKNGNVQRKKMRSYQMRCTKYEN